jgi:hypothetical protein
MRSVVKFVFYLKLFQFKIWQVGYRWWCARNG